MTTDSRDRLREILDLGLAEKTSLKQTFNADNAGYFNNRCLLNSTHTDPL